MKIDTCQECKYFIWPTEYRFYGHCLMNDHYFIPDYMSCEKFVSNEKSGWTAKVKKFSEDQQEFKETLIAGICENCDLFVSISDEYCSHCGARLEWNYE